MTDEPKPKAKRVPVSERERRPLTQAEWEKVHAACVRSGVNPDEAQIALFDALDGATEG